MIVKGKFNVVIDGQFGSTGKGLFSGFLATNANIDIAATNAAPNAGHTYIDNNVGKIVCKHLPIAGVLNKRSTIYLCAGAIINPEVLAEEVARLGVDQNRIFIHPRAAVITANDIEAEKARDSQATSLASTQSGVGKALANKVNRLPGAIAQHIQWSKFGLEGVNIVKLDLNGAMARGSTVLMEVPQGFDLGINEGLAYPHCTSRSVTVSQAMADADAHPRTLGGVSMTLRTYPIRVGHLYNSKGDIIGHSGPFWPDSVETSWDELQIERELTTVTKRVRRVATFSMNQYANSCMSIRPDTVFLNFANYMDQPSLDALIMKMWDEYKPSLMYTGHGPAVHDVMAYPRTTSARPGVGDEA